MPNKKNKSSKSKKSVKKPTPTEPVIEPQEIVEEHKEFRAKILAIESHLEHFAGPLPPPEAFAKYEGTLKGAADRIITMAEKQQNHRQTIEKKLVNSTITNERLGLIFGLIVALGAIGGGVYCVHIGQPVPGAIIGGGGVGSLIAAFVQGSKAIKREREISNKE